MYEQLTLDLHFDMIGITTNERNTNAKLDYSSLSPII